MIFKVKAVELNIGPSHPSGTLSFSATKSKTFYLNFSNIPENTLVNIAFAIDGKAIGQLVQTVTLTVPATTTIWIGATDGNWHTADNWSNGVPQDGYDVIIPYSGYKIFSGRF